MRAPVDSIPAPMFPSEVEWANVAMLSMAKQAGRPVLIEFFDFCRVSSLRTLPYVKAWHEKYEADGLRVISVHCPGYPASEDPEAVRAAVERLGIDWAVCIDHDFALWRRYENKGWPARYLWTPRLRLFEFHYGEGGYAETEQAIQELLGMERELVAPVRPEDDPAAEIVVPTPEQPGAYCGPYVAGGVWVVVDGEGVISVNGSELGVDGPGAIEVTEHGQSTEGELELVAGEGVTVHATAFTPGLV